MRLKHLCVRISEERSPYCPINGAMLLIPSAAIDCERVTNHVAVLRRKISTRSAMR